MLKADKASDGIKLSMNVEGNFPHYLYLSRANIGKSSDQSRSLYFKDGGKPRIEVAEGIYRLRTWYGIKCPNSYNVCSYLTPEQVQQGAQVISVKILMLTNTLKKPWSLYIALKKNE